jgi:hypothetical protein
MEMRWRMIAEVHLNQNSVKPAYRWHVLHTISQPNWNELF